MVRSEQQQSSCHHEDTTSDKMEKEQNQSKKGREWTWGVYLNPWMTASFLAGWLSFLSLVVVKLLSRV